MKIFDIFKSKQEKEQSFDFSKEEKEKILLLAKGDNSVKQECIEAFRDRLRNVPQGTNLSKISPEFNFMREVDNVCPDVLLKNMYRNEVIVLAPIPRQEGKSNDY